MQQLSDSHTCQEGKPLRQKREASPMHDFLVAAAFLLMVILPCIVTMGSISSEEGEEA